ncbi:NAD(P)-dependent alcohol dehydrogenase [Kribbella speibonae]|uniref:NAD(P)-dependent alcohol dehydrogenase n=2 Tax=Kribbella speibonae TaxID=1572660 RepID=A0A4R0ILJ8_9ACTN|nr:NAD(P)-dependent alcohol dehydrogenase [Kribbella speibonae]TCC32068.1 NAD(P)-dependent alcohol dehydrogenase [Kribbella speibonae]
MLAMTQEDYGSTEVLELREIDKPEIGDDEVLVRVRAAGVDRGVWHLMAGLPYPIRLAGYGVRAPKNPVIGMDVAGVVEAIGKDVTRFRPGDEVFGVGKGTFAEYTRCPEAKLALKPANLTFEQAAAVPISAMTALQGVRDHGRIKSGDKVLITGASGGVGSYTVQLAKAFGAEVTAVCSTTKLDLVRSLGADQVVDYIRQDFTASGIRYDVILDIAGNTRLSRLRRILTPTGTLVIMGGETDGKWLGGTDRQLRAMLLSPFIGQRLGTFVNTEKHEFLLDLTPLLESGQVRPVVDRQFPLEEAPKAIRYLIEGHARGKLVITVP